jgi:predicted DNA-binding protein (MmcQ/YjbR family)
MGPSELIAYVRASYGAEPEYLWPDYPQTFIFRHGDNRKWFGVVMEVERAKLGLPGEGRVCLIDVKTGPILGGSYLGQPGVVKAWHMNKNHWLGVLLDGSAPERTLRELLDISFTMTK